MNKIGSMVVTSTGVQWGNGSTENPNLGMNTGLAPLRSRLSTHELLEQLVAEQFPEGGTVVLIDGENIPASGPFNAKLFDAGAATIHTATVHQALVAQLRGGQHDPILPIAGTVDVTKPFGLVRLAGRNDHILLSASAVGIDGAQLPGTAELNQTVSVPLSATGMIDEISRLVPHLLASAQHDNQDTGIVVVCEGVAGNVAMRLPLLMRMNFASAHFGLSLLVDPLATMHGGLLLAREYAA